MIEYYTLNPERFILVRKQKENELAHRIENRTKLEGAEAGENEKRISELEDYQAIYKDAVQMLEETEREITCRLIEANTKREMVDYFAEKYDSSRTGIYDIRRKALHTLKEYLEQNYSIDDLREFYSIDVEKFLRESPQWVGEIQLLYREKMNMYLLNGSGANSPQSSNSFSEGDSVGRIVERIEYIDSRIEKYERYIEAEEKLKKKFPSEYDSRIIEQLLKQRKRTKKNMEVVVEGISFEFGYCTGMVYARKIEINKEIQDFLIDNYIERGSVINFNMDRQWNLKQYVMPKIKGGHYEL